MKEAVVGSITTLDNKVSIPVSEDYTTNTEKNGQNMEEIFMKQVKPLQMWKSCTEETKASDLIIEANPICRSYCKNCYNKEFCAPCIEDGQISIFPSVRICQRCIAQGRQCIRKAVLVITTDCEEGNKQMFLSLKNKIETERTDPELPLTVPQYRMPHILRKVLKLLLVTGFGSYSMKEDAWIFFTLYRTNQPGMKWLKWKSWYQKMVM